jgi:phosphate transport system permease protein
MSMNNSTVSSPTPAMNVEGRLRPSTSSRGIYEYALLSASILFALIAAYFVGTVIWRAVPAFREQGLGFFTNTVWVASFDPSTPPQFGSLSMILGTAITSGIAILIAVVIGTGTALAINFLLPSRLRTFAATLIELLAAVPSVVYGIWGLVVLTPWFQYTVGPWLAGIPGFAWLFGTTSGGQCYLLAGLVLGAMVLPSYVAIGREVINSVSKELIEASLSLGATQWQTLWKTVIPTARIGLFGAGTLALGRAIGETVAMSMVLGSALSTNYQLLRPGATLAGWIATQWGEAQGSAQVPALFALGVILMVVSLSMSLISNRLVARQRRAAML